MNNKTITKYSKLSDFYGMWVLREGDILPIELTEEVKKKYHFKKLFLYNLYINGLLFRDQDSAKAFHDKCISNFYKMI
jgi:hypothetical protein